MKECTYCGADVKEVELHPSIIKQDEAPICPECKEYLAGQDEEERLAEEARDIALTAQAQHMLDNPEDYGLV